MLPLTIVLLALNLFLMLTWLVYEFTMKSGDKAAISDPGAQQSPAGPPVATPDHLAAPPAGAQLATDIVPRPKPQSKPQSKPRPQSKPPVPAKFPAGSGAESGEPGYRVQIFALASDAAVRKAWPRLQKAHPDLLGGLKLKVVRTASGKRKRIVYRMQVGTLSSAMAAKKLCDRLRQRKLDCIIVRS